MLEINYEIDTQFPKHLDLESISTFLAKDKKNQKNEIHFVSIMSVGNARLETFGCDISEILYECASDYEIHYDLNSEIPTEFIEVSHLGSKSIINRVLIIAALSDQKFIIKNVPLGDDCKIMANALIDLGVGIRKIDETTLEVNGCGGKFKKIDKQLKIYLGNSGTSSRFLITLLSLLPEGSSVILEGDKRLSERPIKDLLDVLKEKDLIDYMFLSEHNSFPMKVISMGNVGNLHDIEIDCSESSQFATSILLTAPYLTTSEVIIH